MKENKILISILVPTYNRVKYLQECLDSIVEQEWFSLKELELIVSDNSEWNETKNFMNGYIKKHKNRNIKYNKNEKNLWMVWNWNKLLELKKWEYFVFLSDDDRLYDKTSLKKLFEWLKKYKLDACYWKYMLIDSNSKELWQFRAHDKIDKKNIFYDSFDDQIKMHSISFGWILYHDYWFKYEEDMGMAADWRFNLRYLYNKKKLALLNFYSFCYRSYDNNSIKTASFSLKIQRRWKNYKEFNVKFPIIKTILFWFIELVCNSRIYKNFLSTKLWKNIINRIKRII